MLRQRERRAAPRQRAPCRKIGLSAWRVIIEGDAAGQNAEQKLEFGEGGAHEVTVQDHGEQQRCAIARALALRPEVLCFDEPTSALDPELTGEVLRVIRGLKDGNRTMIVVTHEMAFAKQVADVVIYMADGVIAEMGTPEEVFDHPKSDKARAFLRSAGQFGEAMP